MTPERALGERVKDLVIEWIQRSSALALRNTTLTELTDLQTSIAAFAAEYARERVDALVEAIHKEHGARHGIQPAMGPCPYVTCVAVAKLVAS